MKRALQKRQSRRPEYLFTMGLTDIMKASEGEAMEDTGVYMTAPTTNGDKPLPRRAGVRGMLPSTWISRTVKLEYVGAAGEARETTATLLDWCPVGILVNVAGAKTLLCWERLVLAELVEDR